MTPHDFHDEHGLEDHDRGLTFDLQTLRDRRGVLGLFGAGAATVGGALVLGTAGSAAAAVAEIPGETAGPYPGDGSNGPNMLDDSGIVRSDIRRSFGSSTTRAKGQPFRFTLKLVDTDTEAPLEGLAVYAWHCNRDGAYSLYSSGITGENYLRGVQVTNARGKVRFRSIYPACYAGRWPHIHFEVYENLASATSGGTPLVTSQLALPRQTCMHVYSKVAGYSASVTNLNQISIGTDNVFGDDGGVRQLATVKGSIKKGYRAKLVVPVDA
jgi:protocatechuate 3,4-dioxygenase beta subunit